ncbi:Tetratricopeptide domain protein [Desulfatibacillum aliphaticivorans]|uniref:Tetratricopeptide domain protein n=1 Tax=Desulfatibacillum aliphaticivorans TaxID=218208 RepID=B8FF06_DESAL|nr:tetratricopeptide repeat protein [Desulfatibacillum aliphaticivorans]ACL03823.1 Tetratricopeptide domain protein [Desulfatibacillum aliphaticivorans]
MKKLREEDAMKKMLLIAAIIFSIVSFSSHAMAEEITQMFPERFGVKIVSVAVRPFTLTNKDPETIQKYGALPQEAAYEISEVLTKLNSEELFVLDREESIGAVIIEALGDDTRRRKEDAPLRGQWDRANVVISGTCSVFQNQIYFYPKICGSEDNQLVQMTPVIMPEKDLFKSLRELGRSVAEHFQYFKPKELAWEIPSKNFKKNEYVIAVLPFNNQIQDAERKKKFAPFAGIASNHISAAISSLSLAKGPQIVLTCWDEKTLEILEKELSDDSSLTNKTEMVRGKWLNVDAFIFGRYTIINDQLSVTAKIVEVQNRTTKVFPRVAGSSDASAQMLWALKHLVTLPFKTRGDAAERPYWASLLTETKDSDALEACLQAYTNFLSANLYRYMDAVEYYKEALSYDNGYLCPRVLMASCYSQWGYQKTLTNEDKSDGGKYKLALQEAEKAYNQAKDLSATQTAMAHVKLNLGEYGKARKYAKMAVQSDPQNAEAFYFLGLATSDMDDKRMYLNQAVELNPNCARAHHDLGYYVYYEGKKYRDCDIAERCLNEAVKINPGYTIAYLSQWELYTARGDYEKAQQCIDAALANGGNEYYIKNFLENPPPPIPCR